MKCVIPVSYTHLDVYKRQLRILPTSIDASAYMPTTATQDDPPTIAWIGSPENLVYLEMIRPALARLAVRHPALRLKVICSRFPEWPEVTIERVPWSAPTEAAALAGAHIGIMPLSDDEWSRGKCAFKLLQYMAAALPCVASPIGANREAVIDGVSGFHARGTDEWERCLDLSLIHIYPVGMHRVAGFHVRASHGAEPRPQVR